MLRKIFIHYLMENLLNMKYKIVLVPFPFDDFSSTKVRPAICLTNKIGTFNHVIIAFITSKIPEEINETDIIITNLDNTGLKTNSAIKLHRIVTISSSLIKRELGNLPISYHKAIYQKLKKLFALD